MLCTASHSRDAALRRNKSDLKLSDQSLHFRMAEPKSSKYCSFFTQTQGLRLFQTIVKLHCNVRTALRGKPSRVLLGMFYAVLYAYITVLSLQ